jgi:hypothetical protein
MIGAVLLAIGRVLRVSAGGEAAGILVQILSHDESREQFLA